MKRIKQAALSLLLLLCLLLSACGTAAPAPSFDLEDIPEFSGEPYVVLEDNRPNFPEEEWAAEPFEEYSPLDSLGRCGPAYACVGLETMPTEERGSIGQVKPSGWKTAKYDNVDGKYLYNRCHLLGFQLTGENANEENLITGTRYLNVEGMLPFENLVADYVKETSNHVLYRVYCYNNQPGVSIDYATGESRLASEPAGEDGSGTAETYILNTKSKKFHLPGCSGASDMSPSNREEFAGDRQALLDQGYTPCGICKP